MSTVKPNGRKAAGGQKATDTRAVAAASTNSVTRKGRTSAKTIAKTTSQPHSSKQSRASGAGGHTACDTHLKGATGKVARKSRTAAIDIAKPKHDSPQSTISPRAINEPTLTSCSRAAPFSGGQQQVVNHPDDAVAPSSALQAHYDAHPGIEHAPNTGAHRKADTQTSCGTGYSTYAMPTEQREAVASINDAWRKRQAIVRAMTKLSLQAQAPLRRGRDREEATKHYSVVAKDMAHQDYPIIAPYLEAQQPLARYRSDYEKSLVSLVKRMPIYAWAKGVSGLGDVSLAGLIGECSGVNLATDEPWSIGQMKSVSAFWKRMGVAVVGRIRQQRVKGDAAIEHGYVAERRAVLWNIGECIIKAQWRKENTVHAYGKLYGEIKANMQARNEAGEYSEAALEIAARMKKAGSKPLAENLAGRLTASHINNRAKRHVTKRLLRDLFVEWRRLDAEARGEPYAPIAEAA